MREGRGCVARREGVYKNSGGSGVGPSSVRVRVRGGVANRELGGGLVTTGGGCIVGEGGKGDTRPSGGARNTEEEGGHMSSTLDAGRAGVVGYGIGGAGS
jgi:hypothetical protein